MALVTTTTIANWIPELWQLEGLVAREEHLVMADAFTDKSALLKKHGYGDILHVPKVAHITMSAKSSGTDITPTANTEGEVKLTIDQYQAAAVSIERPAEVESILDARETYIKRLAYGAAIAFDTYLAGFPDDFSNTVGTDAVHFENEDILDAIENLDTNNAPDEGRVFVIHPAAKKSLFLLDDFVYDPYKGSKGEIKPFARKQIGSVYNTAVHVSTNVEATTNGHDNGIWHPESVYYAVLVPFQVEADINVLGLEYEIAAYTIYGAQEAEDGLGVLVKGK